MCLKEEEEKKKIGKERKGIITHYPVTLEAHSFSGHVSLFFSPQEHSLLIGHWFPPSLFSHLLTAPITPYPLVLPLFSIAMMASYNDLLLVYWTISSLKDGFCLSCL